MKCYRCGSKLGRQNICLKCGAPLDTYRLIVRRANSLYNSGLEKAWVRDLTGAIEDLQQCLVYDKHHIDARNLLGLIYHEIGEDAEAMAEWAISESFQPEENLATALIKKFIDSDQIEQCNLAVRKYNHSLSLVNSVDRSYDLALLQLQKVVRINPKFVKAYQMMALLYIHDGEYAKAEKILRTALNINHTDVACLRYLQEIEDKVSRRETGREKREKVLLEKANESKGVVVPTYREGSGILQTVLHVFGGVVLGLLVCYFLLIPGIRQRLQRESNEKVMSYGDMLSAKDLELSELRAQLEDMEAEKNNANEQLEGYTGRDGVVAAYEKLLKAADDYYSGEYGEVAGVLDQLDETVRGTNYQKVYKKLKESVNTEGMSELYKKGYDAYQARDFEAARDYLTQCLAIDPDYPDAMFWLGLSYHNLGDKEKAFQYYDRLIAEFPELSYAQRAAELKNE